MSEAQILEGATGGRDENKIATFSVPYFVRTAAEIATVGRQDYAGLQESSRTWQAWNADADGYIVTVVYKGHLEGDPATTEPKDTEQWSLDFDFSEEPLESHPKLKDIKAAYGGYIDENELKFPEIIPMGPKQSSGLSSKKFKDGDKNPMFGTTTYAVMTARVKRSWSSKQIPKGAVNDIGKIYKRIPDAPEEIDKVEFGDRTWLAMPPKISQNGNVWRIENEWLLSPPAGWVEEVYEKADK